MKVKLIFAVVSVVLAGHVLAKDKERAAWETAFKKADHDQSGGLSKAELSKTKADQFPGIKKNFTKVDANKDGQVTIKERDAYVARTQAK